MLDEVTKPQNKWHSSLVFHAMKKCIIHTIPKNFGTQIIMVLRSGALLKLQEDSK